MKYRTKKLVLEVMEYTGENEKEFRKFINATAPIVLGMKKGVWALKFPDGESIFISKESLETFFEPVEEKPKKKKTELPKGRPLPDWVMLGAYFWRDGYGYWRITADSYKTIHIVPLFTDDDDNVIGARPKSGLDFNKEYLAKLIQSGDIEQARLRRWTAKEAIGKVITDRGMSYWQITSADDAYVLVGECKMQYSTLMNRFTQPNGNPCGCLEHFK